MPRPRKKHIQRSFEFRTHGGKRAGAGRKPRGPRSSEPHKTRAEHDPRHPLLVTTRVVEGLGSLRKREMYFALRAATIVVFERAGFRIVHFAILRNHLHLLVEAADKDALASGMQSLLGSAAKRINGVQRIPAGTRRRGTVFADRYHASELSTPRQVRNALSYVLNNWRRHQEDRAPKARGWKVDPFSSGLFFPDWLELNNSPTNYRPPPTYFGVMTWLPRTWLLRVGWKLHGLISHAEVPGPAPWAKHRPKPARA